MVGEARLLVGTVMVFVRCSGSSWLGLQGLLGGVTAVDGDALAW